MSGAVAFFSYVREADQGGILQKLAKRIESGVHLAGVEDFHVYFDRDDVTWGSRWAEVLTKGVDDAAVLIPVIVPLYFKRPWCRAELERFLGNDATKAAVFPVLWMQTPTLHSDEDPLVRAVAAHQYVDWTTLKHRGLDTPEANEAIERMAARIADHIVPPPARPTTPPVPVLPPRSRTPPVPIAPRVTGDRAALARLLLSLFSADELRRFVRYGPDGDGIVSRLPTATASPASLADAVVDAYERDGLIDAAFFARLLADRPRRKPDIDVVRGSWGV